MVHQFSPSTAALTWGCAKKTDPPNDEGGERTGVQNLSPTRSSGCEKHPTSTSVGNTIFSVLMAMALQAARSCMHPRM